MPATASWFQGIENKGGPACAAHQRPERKKRLPSAWIRSEYSRPDAERVMDHDGGESINKFGVLQTQRYRESFNVVSLAFAGFDYNRTFLLFFYQKLLQILNL